VLRIVIVLSMCVMVVGGPVPEKKKLVSVFLKQISIEI